MSDPDPEAPDQIILNRRAAQIDSELDVLETTDPKTGKKKMTIPIEWEDAGVSREGATEVIRHHYTPTWPGCYHSVRKPHGGDCFCGNGACEAEGCLLHCDDCLLPISRCHQEKGDDEQMRCKRCHFKRRIRKIGRSVSKPFLKPKERRN